MLELIIEQTKLPLVVSRLEGDAVISYALQGSFQQGQTLVEMIEATYVAFRRALELMVLNTTCTCQACRNLPNLDLKFFVHYGIYMLQPFPAYNELIGTDVNTVHRLTKNTVTEKTGITAYVLYTQAEVDALGIGEVPTRIQDMHAVWERERHRQQRVVEREDALCIAEHDYPIEPVLMWDIATKPEFFAVFTDSSSAHLDKRINGRIGEGVTYQCAHGNTIYPNTIVAWQPFERFSCATKYYGVTGLYTIYLTSIENGTRVGYVEGRGDGPWLLRKAYDLFSNSKMYERMMRGHLHDLYEQIVKDMDEGTLVQPAALEVASDEIDKAVAESLTMQS